MNNLVRQIHRWLSIVFTVAVIVNVVAMSRMDPSHPEPPPFWVNLLALLPLALLEITGLYLFVLPYATKWRGARRTS